MKKIFFVLLCIAGISLAARQSASAGETKPALQVTVETSVQKDVPVVKLTVTNISNTYQIYQSISCSWQDFWQTNDKNARVVGQEDCAKNSLYTLILAPGEKHVERPNPVLFRGKTGKRTIRFGYARRSSDFTSDELKQIYNSPERLTYFSRTSISSRFKPGRDVFWSAPVNLTAPVSSLLH